MAHLQPLLDFLGQQPFGTQRRLWEVCPLNVFSLNGITSLALIY